MIGDKNVSSQPIWTISRFQDQKGNFLRNIKKFTDRHFSKTIDALMGNEYFRNEVLVLDAKNKRAGVVVERGMTGDK